MIQIPIINIGCPVEVRWSLLTNGVAIPLERERLTLMLRHECGDIWLDFSVKSNTVIASIPGNILRWTGDYALVIFRNKGKADQLRVYHPHAFRVQKNDSCLSMQNNFVDKLILRIGEDGLFFPIPSSDNEDYEIATREEVSEAIASIFASPTSPEQRPSAPDNERIASPEEVSEAIKNIFKPNSAKE